MKFCVGRCEATGIESTHLTYIRSASIPEYKFETNTTEIKKVGNLGIM
jgi:hypothetical protein